MNVLGRGVHATAIQWPGWSTDPWPQELIDFFLPTTGQNILGQIVRATYVGEDPIAELKEADTWRRLPDGWWLIKTASTGPFAIGGYLFHAVDDETFAKCWKPV